MSLRRPDERIPGINRTLGEFWSWAYSDLLSNRNRSVFAEYLVGCALDVVREPRTEWDAVDLRYRGKFIEVKSSAYLQSWNIEREKAGLSKIIFDIAEKHGWDARTNQSQATACRSADCYVFCLYGERDPHRVDLLDLSSWQFYVVATPDLNAALGRQRTIGLGPLTKFGTPAVLHSELKRRIDEVLGLGPDDCGA